MLGTSFWLQGSLRANSLVLSLLVMGRFWCLPEDSFAVKKNNQQTNFETPNAILHVHRPVSYFSPSHLGTPAREQDRLTVRAKHVLHSRNLDSAWALGGLYCWYIGGPKKCHFPTRLPQLSSNATVRWEPFRETLSSQPSITWAPVNDFCQLEHTYMLLTTLSSEWTVNLSYKMILSLFCNQA